MVRAVTLYPSIPKSPPIKKRSNIMLGMQSHSNDSRQQRSYRNLEYEWMFTAYPQLPLESFSYDTTTTSTTDDLNGNSSIHSDLMYMSLVPPASIIANNGCTHPTNAHALHCSESTVTNNGKCKRVRFANPETNSVSVHHWDMDDIFNSWYQEKDYLYFENDNRLTVLALRKARGDLRMLDPRRYTVTGLEKMLTRQQMVHRKLQTVRHVQTVVEAQRQSSGQQDEEQLKAISQMLSKQTIQRAHLRAALDVSLL